MYQLLKNSCCKNCQRRIVVVIVVALAAGWWWHLLDSGLCIPQMRYLNERELIESAIRQEIVEARIKIDGSEESIRQFLEQNPVLLR